jgi:outer membrane cobalamin receptor
LEILNTPITVATHVPLSLRESPGIITVLQREEILASGARDLMDVLRFVPGFEFASDTQGVVGLGVRTNWGHDGKVLLLIDGQEMNETLYGTLQFGGHYPIDNVLRIEIIRGPGSVTYGGFAELAVIKVVTRKGGNLEGAEGTFEGGRMAGASTTLARGHLAYGRAWGESDFSLSYARGTVPQGTGPWQTGALAGNRTVQAGDQSALRQDFLNLKYAWGDLNLQYLRDAYVIADYTGEGRAATSDLRFPAEYFGADYEFGLGDWSFRPRFTIKSQSPWMYTESRTDRNTRTTSSLFGTWGGSRAIRLTMGLEATQDHASIFLSSRGIRETSTYQNQAGLVQAIWSGDNGNLDLGFRYDQHNVFGVATSPRLAFTKATERWHFKILAAGAFRAPSIENLLVNPALVPERTTTYELELGHALGPATYLTANAYHLTVRNPISYGNPAPGVNGYFNFDQVGSKGIELGLRSIGRDLVVRTTLSLSRAEDRKADFYGVTGQPAYHVAFSDLKFTSQVQWQFLAGWSLNPGLLVLGPRYGYRFGETQPSRFGTTTLLNLYLSHSLSNHLEAGLNLTNLGNAPTTYIQGYGVPGTSGNPPLPGPGRELSLRVSFTF